MASLSPSCPSTTISSTPLPKQLRPKLPHQLSLSKHKNLPGRRLISQCKAAQNEHDPNQSKPESSPVITDRRNVLLGLGGFWGAATTLAGNPGSTWANPVAPDMNRCLLTKNKDDQSEGDKCCPPAVDLSKVVDFRFENYPSPVTKVRRPAHEAFKDKAFVRDYENAIQIMRCLPESDPRSFAQQAKIHCAYCDGSYAQLGQGNDVRLMVHANWLFAPFHRWYIYFFERILGSLIRKPDFALPYWNWDHPDGMFIPEMFKDPASSLYDYNRNPDHVNSMVDLDYFTKVITDQKIVPIPNDELRVRNLQHVYVQMQRQCSPILFFGAPYHSGGKAEAAGALENSPHNSVHAWVGNPNVNGGEDMGWLYSAGRDPLFYCHHSNVDRMWSVWKTLGGQGKRKDIDDPDFLNSSFIFYDENCKPVRVYVRDCLDTQKLGYTFQESELVWLKYPPPTSPATGNRPTGVPPAEHVKYPVKLDKVIRTLAKRPKKDRTPQEKRETEETLTIDIELTHNEQLIKFDVFINDDQDHKAGDQRAITMSNYAGNFTSLAHRPGGANNRPVMKTSVNLALDELIDSVCANSDDELEVVIVPRSGLGNVTITGIKIQIFDD